MPAAARNLPDPYKAVSNVRYGWSADIRLLHSGRRPTVCLWAGTRLVGRRKASAGREVART